MTTPVIETARSYLAAGLSVIPVRADGSKAPVEREWDKYAEMIAGERELQRWFGGGKLLGIGIAGGKASGNLAVLDFETTDAYIDWRRTVPADTIDALSECPVVRTPSGGYHVWVRLTECTAGTVLARRPDPDDATKGKVLIEVRGDGHQVLAPGCPAECHKTGKLYEFVDRGWLDTAASGPVPIGVFVNWMETAASLNQWTPAKQPEPKRTARDREPSHEDPGTDFNRRGTWAEAGLFDAGWTWARELDGDRGTVKRPGKDAEGISGTLGIVSSRANHWPFFYSFSTNCPPPLQPNIPYDRFGMFIRLKHMGDVQAATKALLDKGYGVRKGRPPAVKPPMDGSPPIEPSAGYGHPDRIEIQLSPDLHINAHQVIEALAERDIGLFQFERRLVHIRRGVEPPAWLKRDAAAASIETVGDDHLACRISAVARFFSEKEKKRPVGEIVREYKQPPERLVRTARSIPTDRIRPLTAIVTAPTIRPDGSILNTPGYDAATGLYFDPADCPTINVPEHPTRAQVEAAVETLCYPLADFPFAESCHKSAAIAAILSLAGRWTFTGAVPLFLVDANRAGTGKGLLVNLCVLIVTGAEPPSMANTIDDDEMRKRLMSLAMAGELIVKIDNVPEHEALGTASLDSAITAGAVHDRLLSKNEMAKVPLRAVWFASGNNVRLFGDMARRTCHVRLVTDLENPEERPDVKEQHLLDHVRKERGRYLTAALTILRGWFAAGRPLQPLPNWGSFEAWSGIIRQAVVWAGLTDPYATRKGLLGHSDPVAAAFKVLVANWNNVDPSGSGLTAAKLLDYLKTPTDDQDARDALKDAVLELCPGKGTEMPSTKMVGKRFTSLKGRVANGLRLNGEPGRGGIVVWTVKPVGGCGGSGGFNPKPSRENLFGEE